MNHKKKNNLVFGEEARRAMKRGIDTLADAVQVTLGPRGRNVIIQRPYGPAWVSKDGVTVAKEINLKDPNEAMGADLVQEVATKTDDSVGDGTTTATVLARAILNEGLKSIAAGANPLSVKRGIELAKDAAVSYIKSRSKDVATNEDILKVASISANDPKIGSVIAKMIEDIGRTSVITVKESQTAGIVAEAVKGIRVDKGYFSPYMVNSLEKMETVLDSVKIFVTDMKITSSQQVVRIIEPIAKSGRKFGVIVCEDVSADALQVLIRNVAAGQFFTLVVKAPGFGEQKNEILRDIAAVAGAKFLAAEEGVKLEDSTSDEIFEMLGEFDRVISTRDFSTFIGGAGKQEDIDARIAAVRTMIERADSKIDIGRLTDRLSKLSGGIGVINVGGATDVETKEIKHRVEDAVGATKAAIEGGIISGGGSSLITAIEKIEVTDEDKDILFGIDIFKKALEYPLKTIADNAGKNGIVIVDKVRGFQEMHGENWGFDAAKCEFADLLERGIIDPTKVVCSAIENAVSVASLLLTTEVIITEDPEQPKGEEE